MKAILEHHRPPGRDRNSPPSDPDTHIDLAEVAGAADYLLDRGYYGPGLYFHLRDLFFGLAQLGYERPDLHDQCRSLFERIAVATGRDHAKAMMWFDSAADRAPSYAGQARRTLASTFHYALRMGWRPPCVEDELDDNQFAALDRARHRLREHFEDEQDGP